MSDAKGVATGGAEANGGPPRPRFTLTLGVTGHRGNRLTPELAAAARPRVAAALADIAAIARSIAGANTRWFADAPPDLRLVSALADGADQLLATAALDAGYALDAALPFGRGDYVADFPEAAERAHFRSLLARAGTVLELPGDRATADAAYSLVGGAILAASDVLIALWNGEGSGGRGGTGDVVQTALAAGKPVLHVPLDPALEARLIWPGASPMGRAFHSALEPPADPVTPATLARMLARLLLPPDEPGEQAALDAFFAEREQLRMRRIEYPLLLAVTGVQPLRRGAWHKESYEAATRADWQRFDEAVGGRLHPERFAALERGHAWADHLANRFAQSFRSGHVVNFAFSALAVALALFGFLFGGTVKVVFVIVELLLIAAIVANTRVGHAEAWQQRWLDYRQLAERLRPMRSLKLLAVAAPPPAGAGSRTGNRRWTDWYASALWRQLGLPGGRLAAADVPRLADLLKSQEVGPEIAYHHRNAHRMAHLNHRLHQFGSACFILTVLLCLGFLLSTAALDHETASRAALLFTVATATLPAFGTAAYGLRVQGDFAGSAARSAESADALQSLSDQLGEVPSLAEAAAVANAAAAVMLVDLAEWRLTYQQRALEIPG